MPENEEPKEKAKSKEERKKEIEELLKSLRGDLKKISHQIVRARNISEQSILKQDQKETEKKVRKLTEELKKL